MRLPRLPLAASAFALCCLLLPGGRLSAQGFELVEASVEQVHDAMRGGRLTCRVLVEGYLARIDAYDRAGPGLNAVQTVNPRALAEADSLDALMRSAGMAGPLHCVPVLLKDQVETRDMPTTYGSALFADFVPERDATIVGRLEGAGAIILAKTNMGEFASRYVGSAFGIIRNAYDPGRNPSGSSGGTAAGVAASFGLVGIGEDTSGSIRGPAAVHALVGLRPTLQLVSRHGLMPANPTQDTMGPITRTVADAALVLDAIVGYDPEDPITAYSVGHVPETYASALDRERLRGARIGIVREPMDARTDTTSADHRKVRAVFDRAVADLRSLGADVVDPLVVPDLARVREVGNDWETEEATDAYLAEHPNAPVRTLREILLSGVVVPWRAAQMMGLVGRTTDEEGYLALLHRRERLRVAVLQAMADHGLDAVAYATFDHQPQPIAPDVETSAAPADMYGWGDNRGLSPATGFPAITVPAGFTTDDLPVGLELLGRPFGEETLLGLAYAYEQGTHRRRPPPATPALKTGGR